MRLHEKLGNGMITNYHFTINDTKKAKESLNAIKKVAVNTKAHLRRGTRLALTCYNSADAWILTVMATAMLLKEEFKILPTSIQSKLKEIYIEASEQAEKRKPFYLEDENGRRITNWEMIQKVPASWKWISTEKGHGR